MKFTVTYKVNGVQFSATCDTVAEAYECVKAIVKRESAALVERADPDGATPKKQETPDAESSAPATDPSAVPPALAELIKSALRNVMPTIAASLKATNTPAGSAPVINLREVDK